MKIAFLSLLFSLQVVCYSQTKQETIDWILAKVNQDVLNRHPPIGYFSLKLEINIDGNFKVYQYYYENFKNAHNRVAHSITLVEGHLKDLSPNSISTSINNDVISVNVGCTNSQKCLTLKAFDGKVFNPSHEMNGCIFGYSSNWEPNIEERLKSSFIHLIKLYGGKVDTF